MIGMDGYMSRNSNFSFILMDHTHTAAFKKDDFNMNFFFPLKSQNNAPMMTNHTVTARLKFKFKTCHEPQKDKSKCFT